MEGFFFIFVIIGIFAVVAITRVAQATARKSQDAWAGAARALRCRVQRPGFLSPRKIEGNLPTGHVIIDTVTRRAGNRSKSSTRYRALLPRPLGLGLQIRREGFFGGVGKLFGAQDVQVGDAEFDEQVLVKGRSPESVRHFLTPRRRVRILQALGAFPGLVIDDEGVRFQTSGIESDPRRLVARIRRLSELAWFLGARQPKAEHAREEMLQADLDDPDLQDEPLHTTELVPPDGRPAAPLLPGRAAGESPPPEEVAEEPESVPRDEPPPPPPEPLAAPPPLPPEPAPAEPPAALDRPTVCEELFGAGHDAIDAHQTFESRYAGESVSWEGVLRSVEPFSYDFVLGSEAGTKAVLEIHEIRSDTYNPGWVQAIVGLPREAAASLRDEIGRTVRFEGRLLRADGFLRTIYLGSGRVHSPPDPD